MDGGDKRDTSLLGKGTLHSIVSAVYVVGFLHVLYRACEEAYNIRLYAIKEYGPISTFEDILSVCCFWGSGSSSSLRIHLELYLPCLDGQVTLHTNTYSTYLTHIQTTYV